MGYGQLTYAVCVTFLIKEGEVNGFLALVHGNAATSLAVEPACLQFDVLTDPARPTEVFLYEIYEDESAFQDHTKTEHFLDFDSNVSEMVVAKSVCTYRSVRQ